MKNITTHRAFFSAVAIVAALALPMVAIAANKLVVQDNSVTPVDKFVVTDQGWVGIGTAGVTSLSAPLHIKGSTAFETQLFVENTGATPYSPQGSGGITFFRNNANSALPLKDDRLGSFLFGGTDKVSAPGTTLYRNSAGIVVRADDLWTSTSSPSYITFETTAPGSVNRTEKLKITGVGNVGIGVPFPLQKLEINGGVRLITTAGRPGCDINKRGTFWFTQNNTPGIPDSVSVCVKNNMDAYLWMPLF